MATRSEFPACRIGAHSCRSMLAFVLLLAMVAAACGTRLSGEELEAARGSGEGPDRIGAAPDGSSAGMSGVASEGGTTGSGSGGAAAGGQGARTGASSGGSSDGRAQSPLVLGSVGTWSGPVGGVTKPMTEILGPWVRDLNSRGGVDGHPIERIVVDDGGDPARHFAAVRDLVENRGVFAFVMNSMVLSGSESLRQYLEQRGVPVVGGDVPDPTWYGSPIFFPQITTLVESAISLPTAMVGLRPQLKRWGQMNCREVQACDVLAEQWAETAERLGLSVVYRGQVSLAQPDYTAECLQARDAGAEILAVGLDPNAMRRVGQSCARQGYRPTFAMPSLSRGQNGDANLEGAIGVLRAAPWMAVGVPGVRAMHDAIRRYAPDLEPTVGSTMGWAAGKLFEAGAAEAGGLGSPPTRERLIDGLYRLRGETNGGVSPPLTFERGTDKLAACWFIVEFRGGSWKEANGGRHDCP